MNESGAVAFRAVDADGRAGVFLAEAAAVHAIATAGDQWSEFHGLPVVTASGGVVFRATLVSGRDGIYVAHSGSIRVVAETGSVYSSLGFFPSVSEDEVVAFAATLHSGSSGIFRAEPDGTTATVLRDGAFESYRGALIADDRNLITLATPHGRTLGLFRGSHPVRDRLLGLNDSLLGSTVIELAANPVSINRHGQAAVRVSLADGREAILTTR